MSIPFLKRHSHTDLLLIQDKVNINIKISK